MTIRSKDQLDFPGCQGRRVEARFDGGAVTSDAGVLLLRQADRRLGLLAQVAKRLKDSRDPGRVTHSQASMLRQRVYGIALGNEDLNDHDTLRNDLALQTAVDRVEPLASSPTLCRLENRAERETAWAMHEVLVEQFIASFREPPRELILDFDPTDDPVHGNQVGKFFHGFYDEYCFLPLYVFCQERLLVAYLRPANRGAAYHAGAILKLLVKRLRQAWPGVRIVFRADSGFCTPKLLGWCDRNGVDYIVGLAKNKRLNTLAGATLAKASQRFAKNGRKARLFTGFRYATRNWKHKRRVIARIEHDAQGSNPRYVVTSLTGAGRALYEQVYCARGEMENRIKEQLQLFSDRTSCHDWWPNQFRLLLSSMAYVLVETIRRLGLQGTELARAQVSTIRLKLLKIGAVIVRNTRRVRFFLSSGYPHQSLFRRVVDNLAPS
jgi:hypothetical protein